MADDKKSAFLSMMAPASSSDERDSEDHEDEGYHAAAEEALGHIKSGNLEGFKASMRDMHTILGSQPFREEDEKLSSERDKQSRE